MKYRELKLFLQAGLVASVRVAPFARIGQNRPHDTSWCIGVLVKKAVQVGTCKDVLESDRSTKQRVQIRRFASLDSAAKYLKQLGVTSFAVDLNDTFAGMTDAAGTELTRLDTTSTPMFVDSNSSKS